MISWTALLGLVNGGPAAHSSGVQSMRLPALSSNTTRKTTSWDLKNQIGDTVKSFTHKADATAGGVLARAVKRGTMRDSVTAMAAVQEERTFPRSADPRRSPG